MKLIERLLNILNPGRQAVTGALAQPNELKAQITLIRAKAFQRITGRRLITLESGSITESSDISDLKKNLSPSRRLLRRGI